MLCQRLLAHLQLLAHLHAVDQQQLVMLWVAVKVVVI